MHNHSDQQQVLPGIPVSSIWEKDNILQIIRCYIGWNRKSFPGSQPVSLKRNDINYALHNDYVVCEKTDGIRALLLATSEGIFLTGRNDELHYIPMRLPVRGSLSRSHIYTLLDGEIVTDEVETEGVKETKTRFMCYDGIYVNNCDLRKENFLLRLSYVYSEVIVPLSRALKTSVSVNIPVNPKYADVIGSDSYINEGPGDAPALDIYLKDFFDISQIAHVEELAKRLPHISDGLIFTPVHDAYKPGTFDKLLKWKPPHLNTVDFSIDVLYDERRCPRQVELYVMKYGTRVFFNEYLAPYGHVYKKIMEMAINSKVTQLIVECSWITDSRVWTFIPQTLRDEMCYTKGISAINDGKFYNFDKGTWVQGGWHAERIRYDKKLPNSVAVANSVKASIEDDITFEMLMDEFNKFARRGKVELHKKCIMPQSYTSRTVY